MHGDSHRHSCVIAVFSSGFTCRPKAQFAQILSKRKPPGSEWLTRDDRLSRLADASHPEPEGPVRRSFHVIHLRSSWWRGSVSNGRPRNRTLQAVKRGIYSPMRVTKTRVAPVLSTYAIPPRKASGKQGGDRLPRRPDLDFGPGSYSTCPGGGSETPGVPCGRGRERIGGITRLPASPRPACQPARQATGRTCRPQSSYRSRARS